MLERAGPGFILAVVVESDPAQRWLPLSGNSANPNPTSNRSDGAQNLAERKQLVRQRVSLLDV
jgi:hypothetical protein